jgi:hypothetical protein
MAHFAEIDENNIVTRVIVINNTELLDGEQESETKGIDFCESLYGHRNWVQTSFNGNIRYNYAGVGDIWDSENEAFYAPQPFSSWSLDENFIWQPPVAYPVIEEGSSDVYTWNEETQTWDLVTE